MKELEKAELYKIIEEMGEEKFKAMEAVVKVSRNNKIVSLKLRNYKEAMKKLEFTFEKILGWNESEESNSACTAALKYIKRIVKENR